MGRFRAIISCQAADNLRKLNAFGRAILENSVIIAGSPEDFYDYTIDIRNEQQWNDSPKTIVMRTAGQRSLCCAGHSNAKKRVICDPSKPQWKPRLCKAGCMDLEVSPALTIPTSELSWRFSRSSGPGGQHVNTSDSRVELSWNIGGSAVLTEGQRLMLVTRLEGRLVAGVITVTASEQRSQLRNREIALAKLADLVAGGLAPEAAPRRATKPTRGSNRRRLAAKEQRSATKRQRKRPSAE